ncbi:MAG: nucleotide exchange factor GrpE [Marinilabiliales bacterium]|jgi:molecular chaperone GrpE|nr:MAG: nucleotide exchange factor GrpE [Marinilabiliales bacterium]
MVQKKEKDLKDIEKETAKKEEAKQSKKRSSSKKSSADKKLNELKEKNDELNDKFLRLYSEFDNYRKRTIKEKMDLQKSASRDLIDDLLPVLDDFERALQAFTEDKADSEVFKGIELIYNKLFNLLSQKGLEPMNSMGTDFNTDYHEAITNIEAGDELKGKVVDVIQKGYLLNGKVLRFAKVVVGS